MEAISISIIIIYVSKKFIDQFIKEEGYNRLKKWLFPKSKYSKYLINIIYNAIDEHEKNYPYKPEGKKYPFYHSQILFEELNKYILFESEYSEKQLAEKFNENPNVIVPSLIELRNFYKIFVSKISVDSKLKKLFIDENYKEKIFDINASIKSIAQDIKTIKEQLIFDPDKDWFKKQCNASILDLGNRYTSELNFKLEISEIFEGIGRTDKFQKIVTVKIDNLITKGKKVLKNEPLLKEHTEKLEKFFDDLLNIFNSITFTETHSLPTNELQDLLNNAQKATDVIIDFYYTEESKLKKDKNDNQYFHKYGYVLKNLREFDNELLIFSDFINSTTFKLANNPYLVLEGEAGIGKSHLIGDIVTNRVKNNYDSVFLLGQHFVTEEDPWTQIFKRLQITSNKNDFLAILNEYGKSSNQRLILFIDAINEGRGKYFWQNFVNSFVNDIKTHKWLGLVLTIRSSYKDLVFPPDQKNQIGLIEHTLYGFRNVEYEASKLFFNNYKIELPSVPLLHPEFQNPLFLKLFCEGLYKAGLTKIPDGLQGITSIINFFLNSINNKLANPNRLDYSNKINIVKKSVETIILYKIENRLRYVQYEKAYELIEAETSYFINKKGVLDELIKEGVFSVNLFWKPNCDPEDGIYLAYERFEDHLISQYLIEKYPNLDIEFKDGGKLFDYVKDEHTVNINRGLIEAFSIQIPELKGNELFDYIPNLKDKYPIVKSFIESLLWRRIDTIDTKSKEYVNNHVFSYRGTFDLFWETIISVTAIPNHYFNANFLHKYLMKLSLAERDAGWTQILKYKYDDNSSVKRLIDWAWNENDKSHVSDESIKLASIALAWFHTSTNRQLRDCSTKALICLLQNRFNVLLELLDLFKNVNDPYVYERLFAVAYGCAVRTRQVDVLKNLSDYIFDTIFNEKAEIYPQILLRDYARNIIEYSHYQKCQLNFDLNKIRPPYISKWPDKIPTEAELKEKYDNSDYSDLWNSVMGFGDFARYTIGTNSHSSGWSGFKKSEIPIDREKLLEEFKTKLSIEQLSLFNNLDPIICDECDQEFDFGIETLKFKVAIGRKSEEELNCIRVEFKKKITPDMLSYYEKEIEPFLDHNHNIINTGKNFDLRIAQRIIFSRVIELGWAPELHGKFDKEIGTGRGRSTYPHERIGKKYQWIAYYEYMARLADNFVKYERWSSNKQNEEQFQGPWDPYVRDIDPTLLINKTGSYLDEKEPDDCWWSNVGEFNWQCSNIEWINNQNDLPRFEELIQVKDLNAKDWLILEGYPRWAEPKKIGEEKWDYPSKEFWCQIRSYIVKNDKFGSFKEWAIKQNYNGRWMPESSDRYEMYSREYYWSPAHKYFQKEYYEGEVWRNVHEDNEEQFIAQVVVTTESYLWEEEFDNSKLETISFLKPCTMIYEGMKLLYSKNEGEFIDSTGEIICFAANVYHNSESQLFIKKEPFLKFLQENDLNILWTILGEKQVIGGRTYGNDYLGHLEINGALFYEDNILKGKINKNVVLPS